jgi:hypothetical protein
MDPKCGAARSVLARATDVDPGEGDADPAAAAQVATQGVR